MLAFGGVDARAVEHQLVATETLSAIEMNRGDVLAFRLKNGEVRRIEVVRTAAQVLFTTLKELKRPERGAGTLYEMSVDVTIDGHPITLRRYVASQEAFYEPYVINGVRLWFDAVSDIGEFLNFTHGDCKPNRDVRFALQDASLRICPDELLPWYPGERRFIDIADTYSGDDCWLGPYYGADAHGGLDVNQPKGTVNFTPLAVDDQFYFNSLAKGHNNNRWRGVRSWPNGDTWKIQTHHLLSLFTPEHTPLAAGDPIGLAAGIRIGEHPHSHYNFKVVPAGASTDIDLDPWILMWQIFEDAKHRSGDIHAAMAPLSPAATGAPVAFSAAGSRPGPRRAGLQYSWDFGDGGGSLAENPVHRYARPGIYPVTLTVFDGAHRATTTQHVTVDGDPVDHPVLGLDAPDETRWRRRPLDALDVYGIPPSGAPRTLEFLARPGLPPPRPREVHVVNLGARTLPSVEVDVAFDGAAGWLSWEKTGEGNQQVLLFRADCTGLSGARYTARVTVKAPGAGNEAQSFVATLLVPTHPAQIRPAAVVDNEGMGFWATPWFWIGHRFHHVPAAGVGGFHLVNGRRARADAIARFTPDLRAGRYTVALSDETPFSPDASFNVRIRHAAGDETIRVEPALSRSLGTFEFLDGVDGFVEISAAGATGQVSVDAVVFTPVQR